MIKILIADDHTILREGLKKVIHGEPDMRVTGEARDGAEAIGKVTREDYDCIILDLSMPGRSGLEVLKDIKILKPKTPVLILTLHPEEQYAKRALKAKASGYLTKSGAPAELIEAIRKVCAGGRYITASLAEALVTDLSWNSEKMPHERLSDRELAVARLIASGRTVSEIAEELSLSVKTVSTYRSRALEKMGFQNNAEITHYFIKEGLVD